MIVILLNYVIGVIMLLAVLITLHFVTGLAIFLRLVAHDIIGVLLIGSGVGLYDFLYLSLALTFLNIPSIIMSHPRHCSFFHTVLLLPLLPTHLNQTNAVLLNVDIIH